MTELKKHIDIFLKEIKPEYKSSRHGDRNYKRNLEFGDACESYTDDRKNNIIKTLTYEEAFDCEIDVLKKKLPHSLDYIPSSLYNKKIKIDDYTELSIYHTFYTNLEKEYEFDYKLKSRKYAEITRHEKKHIMVILQYHGVNFILGDDTINKWIHTVQYTEGFDSYNKCGIVLSDTSKPYYVSHISKSNYPHYYAYLRNIIKNIDVNSMDISDVDVVYEEKNKYDTQLKPDTFNTKSLNEIDMEFFVKNDMKDGIYKPEPLSIDKFIQTFYNFDSTWKHKNLLQKLGVHTVVLRGNTNYNINCFNLKNIKVKAPKTVIELYNLSKYCIDENIAKEIEDKKSKQKAERKLLEHNNKFTLIQHGKVIFEYTDKEKLIEYLENFLPSGKSFEDEIIDQVKPIFNKYKDVKRLYIGYWGHYYKYELRGEKCDFNYFDDLKDIPVETANEIEKYFNENLYPNIDETILYKTYGEEHIQCIGVEKVGKKLQIFVESYDLE